MERLLKYLGYTLFLPLWWLQLLVPRRKDIWVFGAWYGKKYSDNSRYLFEYVNQINPDIKAIWITKSPEIRKFLNEQGYSSYTANSFKGIIYCLLAKYVIVSSVKKDVNPLWINGATTIQLWHGNPMKKIGLDDRYSESHRFFYRILVRFVFTMAYEFNYDYVVSNARIFTGKMATAFNIPEARILETGCPRNDVFYRDEQSDLSLELGRKFPGSRLIFYLPTFRDNSPVQSLLDLETFDEGELQEFLEKENLVFITKAHFAAKPISESDTPNNRIIHLRDDVLVDINFLLKDADILITDYSGAYFDFLLVQRPILFAAFDLEDYLSNSRELYFEYNEVVAGPIVKSWEELYDTIREMEVSSEKFNAALKEKNNIFNKYHDGDNSKRVYEAILNL